MEIQIPDFKTTDDNRSVLSNFKLLSRNWEDLKTYLEALTTNISDLVSHDIIQSIINQIILNINQYKNVLTISSIQIIGSTVVIQSGTENYSVERIDASTFKIFKSNDVNINQWNTIPVIININRTDTGDVIHPIITKNVGNGTVPAGAGAFQIVFNSPVDFDFNCVFI